MVFSWFAHTGSVTPVGRNKTCLSRGLPIRALMSPLWEARKEGKRKKNTLCKTCFFRGLPSLGAWSFVGGGPQAGGQRTPFSESLVCFLSLTEFEMSADSEFRIILLEGIRQCPWCMHRARVLGVKPAGERYALKKVAQLLKEKDVLAM